MGRLRQGVALPQAEAQFSIIAAQLQKQYPQIWMANGRPQPLSVVSATAVPLELRKMVVGFGGLLIGAVGIVLLIACSNLASFLLARATMRRKEISIRLAFGASRRRLVQQLLTENSLLAILGGTLGFLAAVWAKNLLVAFAPNIGVPLVIDLSLDYRVLAFSILVTFLTAVAVGLAPALRATKLDLAQGLNEGAQSYTTSRGWSRVRNGLIVGQVALSLALLMCAGMFLSSAAKLRSVDVGFDSSNLALLSVDLGMAGYSSQQRQAFIARATNRLRNVPGTDAVAVAARVPLGLSRLSGQMFPVDSDSQEGKSPIWVGSNNVGPNYLETMRIPLLRGRAFTRPVREGAPQEAIVNDTLAGIFWPNEDPIGKRIQEMDGKTLEVVGVVRTGKYDRLSESPAPFVYAPLDQDHTSAFTFHLRTRIPPEKILHALRKELRALDPALTVFDVQTMDEHLADSILPIRMGAILLGIFGALALSLASVGLYGLLAYLVCQRAHEISIRMALGATPRDVLKFVLMNGMSLTVRGMTLGFGVGFVLSLVISSQLYGMRPADVVALVGVAVLQLAVALLACYIPARRAMRVDLMIALRYE
jgi:predicted permease